jgi:PKHD-type hydroxylase
MNRYWVYYKAALTPEWCDWVINKAVENYPVQDGIIGFSDKHKVDQSWRKSKVRWLDHRSEDNIVRNLWLYANWANRDVFDFDLRYIMELQFTEYHGSKEDPGKYGFHHDVDWKRDIASQRKLSIVIQLSDPDDYEGGALQFDGQLPQPPAEDIRQRGTVIVFPSFHLHRVTEVTAGLRYSLVTWVEGPHWR